MKVVLYPKIRTTECTHQTTVSTQNELMIDNNVDLCANPTIDRLGTKELNTRAILAYNRGRPCFSDVRIGNVFYSWPEMTKVFFLSYLSSTSCKIIHMIVCE